MIKMSFKIQMTVMIITIIAVICIIVYFVNKTNSQAQFAQTKAQQTADYGFQEAMLLLEDVSGKTDDGGEYSVKVIKDTISADSIEIKIESFGVFAGEMRSTSRRILLISPDSISWLPAN